MSSEQIPFTISTKNTVAPEGPHGVAPSDVQVAVVAEEDKTLTTKVGEKLEQLKESAQPVIQPVVQAAQPYIAAASEVVSNVTQAGKDAVVSGATTLGLTSQTGPSTAPHGVPPSEAGPGVVADQDKSLTTRVGEAVQPVIQPVVQAAQPYIAAASGAVSSATGVVVSGALSGAQATTTAVTGAVTSGATALGIMSTQPSSTPPEGPHGVPPSEASGLGVVAQEDKSYTTRVGEAVQPVLQPVVNAAQPYIAAAANVASNVTQTAADTISSGGKAIGIIASDKSVAPEGPHGIPPSETSGLGVVAQEDKSYTTRLVEGAQPVIQPVVNAAQVVVDYANKATGAVGQQFANIGQQVGELRDATQDTIHLAERKAGLPVHVNPGERPEAPHGVAPTNYNHGGVVSEQDKSIPQKVGEKIAEIKEQTVAQVTATVGQVGYQAGLTGHPVVAGEKPEAPHGVAPSSGNHAGLVSEQDKNIPQKVGEQLTAVKDQVVQKVEEVRSATGV